MYGFHGKGQIVIHISNITFYYNRFSTSDSVKRNMGKLYIQLLRNGSWESYYVIEKNTEFSVDSTTWTLLNLDITSEPKLWYKTLI